MKDYDHENTVSCHCSRPVPDLIRQLRTERVRYRSTMEGAEAQIAAQARQHCDQYKITSANTNNRVYMTAELYK